jgi:pyruvate,water dikinase
MENCKLRKPLPNEINFELLYNPPTQQDKIIGLIACKGIKQGTARIVLKQKDLKLLGPDEILVTPMTAPNYLPYISKVGGIITDDGGTTSHASIISREFQIPCITGTGIATSKIKDGDLILLNANEGYAEIIKKSDRLNN